MLKQNLSAYIKLCYGPTYCFGLAIAILISLVAVPMYFLLFEFFSKLDRYISPGHICILIIKYVNYIMTVKVWQYKAMCNGISFISFILWKVHIKTMNIANSIFMMSVHDQQFNVQHRPCP